MFVTTVTSAKQNEDDISRGKPHTQPQRTTTPNLSIQTKTQLHRSGITFYKNQHTALFLDCAVRITRVFFFLYSMAIIKITVMSSGLTRVSQRKQHF